MRVSAAVVGLAAVLALAWLAGLATRPAPAPVPVAPAPPAPAAPPPDLPDLPDLPDVRVVTVDGYQVRLDGDLVPGVASPVFTTVSRDGRPVTDLAPVDGAFGALTVVGPGGGATARPDVHPDAAPPVATDRAGPAVAFLATVPTAGTYRLILDFDHGGGRHSTVFTVSTPTGSGSGPGAPDGDR